MKQKNKAVQKDDKAPRAPESQLIFEARPTLEDWKPHLPRFEVFLDAPMSPALDINLYAQQSGLANGPNLKVLHLEREQLHLDDQLILSTRREISVGGNLPKAMQMRQYIMHALVPIPELDNEKVGLWDSSEIWVIFGAGKQ